MNQEQFDKVRTQDGFLAALDQSGGSTPKALRIYGIEESEYSGEAEMFDKMHEMRARIIRSKSFGGDRILGAILFEMTMDRDIDGKPLEAEPTRQLAQRLHALRIEGLTNIGVNGIKYGMRVPNDEHFDLQWNHGFARIPQAWDLTVGGSDVVVAVVDSGMNLAHPDALGRLLLGQTELVDQLAVGRRLFQGIQVGPLHVLDQGQL